MHFIISASDNFSSSHLFPLPPPPPLPHRYNDPVKLKAAADAMKAEITAAADDGAVVTVITVAEVAGTLNLAADINEFQEADKADLLGALTAIACDGVADCTVVWAATTTTDTRRRALESISLAYTVRVMLDASAPALPEASCYTMHSTHTGHTPAISLDLTL